MSFWLFLLLAVVLVVIAVVLYDLTQREHAILRNFPILGHFRYLFEAVGPELRQYIVTSNDEERPFSRDQRTWIYASAKRQNNYFGFGTDNELERSPNYLVIKHSAFPKPELLPGDPGYDPSHPIPGPKILGAKRARAKAFRPASIVNLSGMSFGSLGARAIEALNLGAKQAGCLHNTGEGGISPYHLQGGDLVWQLGTGYFGARDRDGRFSMDRLVDGCAEHPVRAIEVKLSQGAKPGKGGLLPAAKATEEIARIRGVPVGEDCVSPPGHSAFADVSGLLDFVEDIAQATGLPVGIKSAVGDLHFWIELAQLMEKTDRGVDFIAIDGGEGGTGAAPLVFSDHVSLPFKMGMSRVFSVFAERGLQHDVVWIGAGKLGFPITALFAFALGCDQIAVGREAMMAIGCIQAQRCHTGHCPTGVATHSKWLMRGLDPTSKSARLANYIATLRKELLWLCHAVGVDHPAEVTADHFEILDDRFGGQTPRELFGYEPHWTTPREPVPDPCTPQA